MDRLIRQFASFTLSVGFSLMFLAATLAAPVTARADVAINPKPFPITEPLPPNLLYILDDSGSMLWGITPDGFEPRLRNNRPSTVRCNDNNIRGAVVNYNGVNVCRLPLAGRLFATSSTPNTQYYDPKVTYRPPVSVSGISYPDITDFSRTPFDGFNPATSNRINLATQYLADIESFQFSIRGNSGTGTIGMAINGPGPAFYHVYNRNAPGCGDNYEDACYRIVTWNDTEMDKQNFANWFSYYRTRLLTAKSGTSTAFSKLPDGYRVGWTTLNTNNSNFVNPNVASLNSNRRNNFDSWLRNLGIVRTGTPLVSALNRAGQYYQNNDSPYQYVTSTGRHTYSCQPNFTILMTDGYTTETDFLANTSNNNQDGTNGNMICPPGVTSGSSCYQYTPVAPYSDTTGGTLADIAMRYWKTDLRPTLANNVPTTPNNPAFWQHMVTIGLALGVSGNVSRDEAFAAVAEGRAVRHDLTSSAPWGNNNTGWLNPRSSDQAKLDDLLHAAINSRGDFFSAQTPDEFVQGVQDALAAVAAATGSRSSLSLDAGAAESGSRMYQALYNSQSWDGRLLAYKWDTTNKRFSNTPAWQGPILPSAASRTIIFKGADGTQGDFIWNNLTASQRTALTPPDDAQQEAGLTGEHLLAYLRGQTANTNQEGDAEGQLRNRRGNLIGAVVHASPVFMPVPNQDRFQFYSDLHTSYKAFAESLTGRPEMLFMAANDGKVHAVRARDGVELFAYVPSIVDFSKMAEVASQSYAFNYLLDGELTVTDVQIGDVWRTVLVGSLGRGGAGIFALDVTDPADPKILWEIDTINVDGRNALGQITGKPQVVRLPDASWAVLFNNGYNSELNQSALVVVPLVESLAQNPDGIRVIKAGAGQGLSAVNAWSSTNNARFDKVYAGDLQGNFYEFDLTTTAGSVRTVFKAAANQQISTAPVLTNQVLSDGTQHLWALFGTGQLLNLADLETTDTQSIYGIKVGASEDTLTPNHLENRAIKVRSTTNDDRIIDGNAEFDVPNLGWKINLNLIAGERIVYRGSLMSGFFAVPTLITESDPCLSSGDGYVMAVNPFTGLHDQDGAFFQTDEELNLGNNPYYTVGKRLGALSELSQHVDSDGNSSLWGGDPDGNPKSDETPPPDNQANRTGRISWRELNP